ncbi:hypothetical protein MINTM008_23740 [Mycobacterium intracellulare]|nr:hypothetical protein MINTM005_22270 [Mycobacterium intracellulare]BCO67506.1 hypothetical protein MINTM007_21170 [Mycobacterium intracellulare]BCO73039.1 hypothetical protein MINTM008_23740 [Mycobacterium intracellulare]BCO94087.1 hypothetical protein MINTM016_20630 [Mycobacterium intracellulare]BCP31459.1 hypothetical protein MINTM026_24290 [Mycobacterium intracellulare]
MRDNRYPLAQVLSVSLEGERLPPGCVGKVTVRCPHCQTLHTHRIYSHDSVRPPRTAPCTGDKPVLRYRIDLAPVPSKREVSQPRPVYTPARGSEHLNDNAIDVPALNWEE